MNNFTQMRVSTIKEAIKFDFMPDGVYMCVILATCFIKGYMYMYAVTDTIPNEKCGNRGAHFKGFLGAGFPILRF